MTDSVVEKPGLEATVIGLLRTVYGTMRTFIGIADAIGDVRPHSSRRNLWIEA